MQCHSGTEKAEQSTFSSDRPKFDPKTCIPLYFDPLLGPNNIALALVFTRTRSYICPAMSLYNPRLVAHILPLVPSGRPQRYPINKFGPRWLSRARIAVQS